MFMQTKHQTSCISSAVSPHAQEKKHMQSYGAPDWVFRQGSCYLCLHSPAFLEMKSLLSLSLPTPKQLFPSSLSPHSM